MQLTRNRESSARGALGRAIIRHRPYRSVDDLMKKKVLRRSVFEKIKNQVKVQ